jgi:hypothetical protein
MLQLAHIGYFSPEARRLHAFLDLLQLSLAEVSLMLTSRKSSLSLPLPVQETADDVLNLYSS